MFVLEACSLALRLALYWLVGLVVLVLGVVGLAPVVDMSVCYSLILE